MKNKSRRVAMLLGAGGLAIMIVPTGIRAETSEGPLQRVDLSVVCLTAGALRISATNTSSLPVVVDATEAGLGASASDELRVIFPITVPALSKHTVTWDLPVPAHHDGLARRGLLRAFHGAWFSRRWTDENGLTYRSTGGIDLQREPTCPAPTIAGPDASSNSVPTTNAAPGSSSSVLTTTVSPLSPAPAPAPAPVLTTAAPTVVSPSAPSPATTPAPTKPAPTKPSTAHSPTVSPRAPAPALDDTFDPDQPSSTPVDSAAPDIGVGTPAGPTTSVDRSTLVEVAPIGWASTTNSQLAGAAFDHSPDTFFATQMQDGAHPTTTWVSADLGRAVALSRIEWMWSAPSTADDAAIRVSVDGITWVLVHQLDHGNPGEWMGADVATTARFVRFTFRNPSRDPQLGYLAEIRVLAAPDAAGLAQVPGLPLVPYGRPAPESGTVTVLVPSGQFPGGSQVTPVDTRRSSNSPPNSSKRPIDGNPATAWATSMSVAPWSGWVSFDLGSPTRLRTVRWTIVDPQAADSYRVQVSVDGVRWQTVAVQTNPASANEWLTLPVDIETRHVRFYFRNPNLDANIGTIGEAQFFVA